MTCILGSGLNHVAEDSHPRPHQDVGLRKARLPKHANNRDERRPHLKGLTPESTAEGARSVPALLLFRLYWPRHWSRLAGQHARYPSWNAEIRCEGQLGCCFVVPGHSRNEAEVCPLARTADVWRPTQQRYIY